jgi:hypothetical protein
MFSQEDVNDAQFFLVAQTDLPAMIDDWSHIWDFTHSSFFSPALFKRSCDRFVYNTK